MVITGGRRWPGLSVWSVSILLLPIVSIAIYAIRKPVPPSSPSPTEVIVYCSADAPVAQPVFDAFEKKTSVKVRAVFDTEATKTTGLVNRLLDEHDRAQSNADVWWSSEPFGTIRLARAGVLERYTSTIERSKPAPWPTELRAGAGTWYGFARRVRVLAYNTKRIDAKDVPNDLAGLADAKFKDRIAMARPEFGTTRGHMGAIHALGDDILRTWLTSVAANGLRLYEGNAAVARAVGSGEMWLGLTDSDDALQAQANGWPVDFVAISNVPALLWHKRTLGGLHDQLPFPEGAMQIPNTVALVKGARHPANAALLIDFLLSPECEAILAKGEGRTLPMPRSMDLSAGPVPGDASPIRDPLHRQRTSLSELDLERVADNIEAAMKICGEVLKGR